MVDRQVLARLRITPCGLGAPEIEIVTQTVLLARLGGTCRLEVQERGPRTRRQWRVALDAGEVETRLGALKQATVPAFPVSPLICDGEYVELMVAGEYSSLTLGWWTAPPWGAEELAEFADWLREAGLGHEEEGEDEVD